MTYGLFLIIFVVIPIIILGWVLRDILTRQHLIWIAVLMGVAFIYTTPWDNYLVATRVWWYDPQRVLGIRFGWVPLEEYLFFILQPILAGLWTVAVHHKLGNDPVIVKSHPTPRWLILGVGGVIWAAAAAMLIIGWARGTYLALELVWALPPILLQLFTGAEVLWAQRRTILLTLGSATLYLAAADALAIRSGVWVISPQQSFGVVLAGSLPLEELIFFLLTNTLLIFSIHLLLAWQRSPNGFDSTLHRISRKLSDHFGVRVELSDGKPLND